MTRLRRLDRSVGTRAGLGVDDGLPRQLLRAAAAARAGTAAARRAPRGRRTRSAPGRAARHALLGRHPGPQQLVGGGEVAVQQLRRWPRSSRCARPCARRTARRTCARPGCESTRSAGAWKRADVERPRVPQRHGAGARRPRLVHVHEVERRDAQHLLDRPRDVHRRRRVDPLAARVEQQLARRRAPARRRRDRTDPPASPARPGSACATRARAPATATARATARDARARRAPARPPPANVPTSFASSKRMRRDLGDGEAFSHFAGG